MRLLKYKFAYLKNYLTILAVASFSMVYAQKLEWIKHLQYPNTDTVIRFNLPSSWNFSEFVYIRNEGKWGVLDWYGRTIVPMKFDTLPYVFVNEGCAMVEENGKMGLFSLTDKKYIIPPKYEAVGAQYIGNTISFMENRKQGIMDLSGHILVKPIYKSLIANKDAHRWETNNVEGWDRGAVDSLMIVRQVVYTVKDTQNNVFRKFDMLEEPLMPIRLKPSFVFEENPNNTHQLPPIADIAELLNDSIETLFTYFDDDRKMGLIDKNSKPILSCEYDGFGSFGDFLLIGKNKLWGIYDLKKRQIIISPKYEEISEQAGTGYAIVKKGEKSGILDTQLKEIIPIEYDNIRVLPHCFILTKGNKSGIVAKKDLHQILPFEYEVRSRENSTMVWLCRNGLWGLARIGF